MIVPHLRPPREDSASGLSSIHQPALLVGRGQPGRTVLPSWLLLLAMVVIILLAGGAPVLDAAEPFFKPNDVVALVGGGDMALMRDHPGIELLVRQQRDLSGVRFRVLAQEGDTVFEQFRDLHFPAWEEQLGKVGATVVISQFGRMESLSGTERLPAFITAYEALLDRFIARGRRIAIMSPMALGPPSSGAGAPTDSEAGARLEAVDGYATAQRELASRRRWRFVDLTRRNEKGVLVPMATTRGGHPASCYYYEWIPGQLAGALGLEKAVAQAFTSPVLPMVKEKNTLWFHYWRPQNWAFLAGDRTEQPSSRDHLDPTKRWFPAEMETWLPLVEAKEKEIQTMIESLRKP